MADTFARFSDIDAKVWKLKLADNGDGTYSPAVSSAAASQFGLSNTVWYDPAVLATFYVRREVFNGAYSVSWENLDGTPATPVVANLRPFATTQEGGKQTFTFSSAVVATADGLIAQLQGSASKIVKVTRVEVAGMLTTAAAVTLQLARYSSAATGGTLVGGGTTTAKGDTGNAAPSAVASFWNTAPTPGTLTGHFSRRAALYGSNSVAPPTTIWEFGKNEQCPTLRGTGEYFGVLGAMLGGGSYAGANIYVNLTCTEE